MAGIETNLSRVDDVGAGLARGAAEPGLHSSERTAAPTMYPDLLNGGEESAGAVGGEMLLEVGEDQTADWREMLIPQG